VFVYERIVPGYCDDWGDNCYPGQTVSGFLSISDSIIFDNTAGYGGGIYGNGNSVQITRSTISGNTALGSGGGVFVYKVYDYPSEYPRGGLLVSDSIVSENTAGGSGGGVAGTFRISTSVISENVAGESGGGLAGEASSLTDSTISGNVAMSGGGLALRGKATIDTTTISGNTAYDQGGGLYNTFGEIHLAHTTVAGNSAARGGGVFSAGFLCPDPVYCPGTPAIGTVEFAGSIIASNSGDNCSSSDVGEEVDLIIDSGHNFADDYSCPSGFQTLTGLDPVLRDNGGPTMTHALYPVSSAIDTGGHDCRSTDQRGVPRPYDGDGDGDAACDAGAFEFDGLVVDVDIKPDSYPNSINPYSRGLIPVAILGSDTLDVADVDVTTLAFGPGGPPTAHDLTDSFTYNDHLQDVNLDGFTDLVTHYRTRDTGVVCGDESATRGRNRPVSRAFGLWLLEPRSIKCGGTHDQAT
jgi:hypothetical protein